jgi:RimJ/RimL family protein N-acetyltransferase
MARPITTIRTERLLLRRWRDSDRAPFAAMNADQAVMEFMSRGLLSRSDSDAFVDRILNGWEDKGYGLWAVEVVGGPDFVGYIGLADATFEAPFTPTVEVGWRLATQHWGHGYATEGARAALTFGFGPARLPEILSFTATINRRSRAVMERLGMVRVPDGDFEHPAVGVGDPVRPHVLYRLSEESIRGYRTHV